MLLIIVTVLLILYFGYLLTHEIKLGRRRKADRDRPATLEGSNSHLRG